MRTGLSCGRVGGLAWNETWGLISKLGRGLIWKFRGEFRCWLGVNWRVKCGGLGGLMVGVEKVNGGIVDRGLSWDVGSGG